MPTYTPYDTVKSTPSRKNRKGSRQKTFLTNKAAGKKLRQARKEAREALLEAQDE